MFPRVTTKAALLLISLATTADAGMSVRTPWPPLPAASLCLDAGLQELVLTTERGAQAASAGFELEADARRCFALDVPEAGVVLLGAAFAGTSAEPRLDVRDCGPALPGGLLTLLATPGEWVLQADAPRRLVACVGFQETAGFQVAGTSARIGGGQVASAVQVAGTGTTGTGTTGILRAGFDRPGKKKQIEVEPDGSAQPSWPGTDLCQAIAHGPGDDHGDLPLCASPLGYGSAREGRLDGALDRDVFAFELDRLSTVTFAVQSAGDLAVELLDVRGHRLAWNSARGGMRTKDLAAGVYFLAVGAAEGLLSGEEAYRLALDRR